MELSIDAIPYISMAMAHENVMAAVGTSMLEAKAMELSVNPAVGGNIDIAV